MTPEKTLEQLMEEYRKQPLRFVKEQPYYHTIALLAAQTLPNQSAAELLASADKIEAWLRKPEIDGRISELDYKKLMMGDWKQKSTDSYISASQDTNVFP